MGGSSVPSNTTQTTMLDPTRQKALQQAIGYFNNWASDYKGKSYPGQRVAMPTQDWYSAQRMAHNLASRFAEGGITDIRKFVDGGTTDTSTATDTASSQTDTTTPDLGNPFLQAENQTQYGTGAAYGMANQNWQPNQISSTYSPSTFTAGTITPTDAKASTMDAASLAPSDAYGYNATSMDSASMAPVADVIASTMNAASLAPSDAYKADVTDYKAEGVGVNQISDAELAKSMTANPDKWNADFMNTYMSPYTQGVVDIAKREAERQYQQQLQQQKSQATASGAFGGYRQGVVEAEGARNQAQLLNDIQTKGQQDAYNAAVTQFNADRQALMQTGQFNAQQASQIAAQNLSAKVSAESQRSSQAQAANAANAAAANQASQFNATQAQNLGLANLANQQAANAANAAAANQIALANQQAGLTTNQFNAANQQAANAANAAAANQASQFNATQAQNLGLANLANKQAANAANAAAANQMALANQQAGLTAQQSNQANALAAFNANQGNQQKAADLSAQIAQQNIANAAAARAARLQQIQLGLAGAQQLSGIEGAYNTNNINAQTNLMNMDASARAAQQAQIDDMIKSWDKLQGTELEKAQLLAQLIGTMPGGATKIDLRS